MKKRTAAVMLMSLLLASCANAKNNENSKGESDYYPVTVTTYNAENKEITQTYTHKPERIITGNLSSTETLMALGLGDNIIGMVNPDNAVTGIYADKINSIKKLGDKKTISHETILNEDPDFIYSRAASFAISSSGGTAKAGNLGTPEELNKLDIMMYAQKASITDKNISLEYIIDDVKNIGKIFNVEAKANEYATSLSNTWNEVKKSAENNGVTSGSYKNALVMTGYGEKSSGSGQTYGVFKSDLQEKMLNVIGYTNFYGSNISGSTYTPENLVNQNPELIVYVTSDRNADRDAKALDLMKANDVISEVPAIKNNKIVKINYDDFMDYGPRVFTALKTISDFVYGD